MEIFDNEQALGEGWGIFDNGGSAGDIGVLRIERDDERAVFPGDKEAWLHVMTRAIAGSAYHRRAVAIVFDDNPNELDFIRDTYPGLVRVLGY